MMTFKLIHPKPGEHYYTPDRLDQIITGISKGSITQTYPNLEIDLSKADSQSSWEDYSFLNKQDFQILKIYPDLRQSMGGET